VSVNQQPLDLQAFSMVASTLYGPVPAADFSMAAARVKGSSVMVKFAPKSLVSPGLMSSARTCFFSPSSWVLEAPEAGATAGSAWLV
jgi:hypothetical protein